MWRRVGVLACVPKGKRDKTTVKRTQWVRVLAVWRVACMRIGKRKWKREVDAFGRYNHFSRVF